MTSGDKKVLDTGDPFGDNRGMAAVTQPSLPAMEPYGKPPAGKELRSWLVLLTECIDAMYYMLETVPDSAPASRAHLLSRLAVVRDYVRRCR